MEYGLVEGSTLEELVAVLNVQAGQGWELVGAPEQLYRWSGASVQDGMSSRWVGLTVRNRRRELPRDFERPAFWQCSKCGGWVDAMKNTLKCVYCKAPGDAKP